MIKILIFDVNETLLDLASLDVFFEEKFGDSTIKNEWFNHFIHNSFVSTITQSYQPFGKIGLAALQMIGKKYQIAITNADKDELVKRIKNLKLHPEVEESLLKAKALGFTLVTLTNSTEEVVTAQLTNAGIYSMFDRVFSADKVKRLKPAPESYQLVINDLGLPPNKLMLVAAHAWDIEGALNVGCKAAFIARPGKSLNPLALKPQITASDLADFVEKLSEYEERT